MRNNN